MPWRLCLPLRQQQPRQMQQTPQQAAPRSRSLGLLLWSLRGRRVCDGQ
jgi:hypothetical protein